MGLVGQLNSVHRESFESLTVVYRSPLAARSLRTLSCCNGKHQMGTRQTFLVEEEERAEVGCAA